MILSVQQMLLLLTLVTKEHLIILFLIAGLPDFFVSIRAWQKVKDRVMNGKEENIPFYISGYKEHIEHGKNEKGYHVTIV